MNKILLTIKEINSNNYILYDEINDKEYKMNIEFISRNLKVSAGDKLVFSSELLNENSEKYCLSYTFGDLESEYGHKISKKSKEEIVILIINGESKYLKRIYG